MKKKVNFENLSTKLVLIEQKVKFYLSNFEKAIFNS